MKLTPEEEAQIMILETLAKIKDPEASAFPAALQRPTWEIIVNGVVVGEVDGGDRADAVKLGKKYVRDQGLRRERCAISARLKE